MSMGDEISLLSDDASGLCLSCTAGTFQDGNSYNGGYVHGDQEVCLAANPSPFRIERFSKYSDHEQHHLAAGDTIQVHQLEWWCFYLYNYSSFELIIEKPHQAILSIGASNVHTHTNPNP